MPDRSPTVSPADDVSPASRVLSALRRDLLSPLRQMIAWALVAALAGAVLGAIGGAIVAVAQPKEYTARATFLLLQRPPTVKALSLNRAILAEQTARFLRSGEAGGFARRAADGADFRGEWVAGPSYGQLSFRVTASDPDVAARVARAVYDQSGFLGNGLVSDPDAAPLLDLVEVTAAVVVEQSWAKLIAVGAALGACAGFFLALLVAVPPRRPSAAPSASGIGAEAGTNRRGDA